MQHAWGGGVKTKTPQLWSGQWHSPLTMKGPRHTDMQRSHPLKRPPPPPPRLSHCSVPPAPGTPTPQTVHRPTCDHCRLPARRCRLPANRRLEMDMAQHLQTAAGYTRR